MAPKKRLGSRLAAALGRLVGFIAVSAICGVLAASLVAPSVAAAGVTVSNSITFFNSLPGDLTVDPPSQSTKMVTADGQPIATFYAENRVRVTLDQMSPFIKDAIIAIEDSRFYEHGGLDPQGILRALTFNSPRAAVRARPRSPSSTSPTSSMSRIFPRIKASRSSSAGRRPWATSCGK